MVIKELLLTSKEFNMIAEIIINLSNEMSTHLLYTTPEKLLMCKK